MLLLVKCYDNKMLKSRAISMRLTKKKLLDFWWIKFYLRLIAGFLQLVSCFFWHGPVRPVLSSTGAGSGRWIRKHVDPLLQWRGLQHDRVQHYIQVGPTRDQHVTLLLFSFFALVDVFCQQFLRSLLHPSTQCLTSLDSRPVLFCKLETTLNWS